MSEIWLPIKDYEGWYEVSNMGRVRSVNRVVEARDGSKRFYKGKVLATRPNHQRNDYVVVDLKKNGTQKTCRVQRLVLSTFNPVENMENLQVGHKDENVANNQLDNLY